MKILVIHNFHRRGAPSGDDTVVKNEVRLLSSKGHYVKLFYKENDLIENMNLKQKIRFALNIPWSRNSYQELKKLLEKEKFDIVHIHNLFPFFSISIYKALKEKKVPFVHTLHDFRLFCSSAFLFRKGHVCELCPQKNEYFSLLHKCFQNSYLKSLPVYAMLRKIKLNNYFALPSYYIVLSKFAKEKFIEFGIPSSKITVKPNFLDDSITPSFKKDNYIVFSGRISEEKGIKVLLKAFSFINNITLKIVGSGPLSEEIKTYLPHNVSYLGFKSKVNLLKIIKKAKVLIMPSIWYEGFPLTLIEAFQCGTPVIASRIGSLKYLVKHGETGLLFEPGNPKDLAEKVLWLWNHPEERERMARNARKEYEEKYTPEKNYKMLMEIYEKAIKLHKRRNK